MSRDPAEEKLKRLELAMWKAILAYANELDHFLWLEGVGATQATADNDRRISEALVNIRRLGKELGA